MDKDVELIRALADYFGFDEDELTNTARVLSLEDSEFVVRFTELVSFARSFGVPPVALATLVRDRGSGVQPWRTPPPEPAP